ncbi:hypothetical protein D3C79_670860 [compost metagenome]
MGQLTMGQTPLLAEGKGGDEGDLPQLAAELVDDVVQALPQHQSAAGTEHHQGAEGLQAARHAIFGLDPHRIQAALQQAFLTAVHQLQALPQPGLGKQPQPFSRGHRLGVRELVIRHVVQGPDLAGQRREGGLPQDGAHLPGGLALSPAGIHPGRRLMIYGQHLAPIQGGDGAMLFGGHVAGVKLEGQLAIGVEHRQHSALPALALVPAQLPFAGDPIIRRRAPHDGNRRAELRLDPRQHDLFQPGAGVQQDELRQLAGASAIGDGAAQQLARIQLIPGLTGHAVGPLVVIEGGDRQAPAMPGMVAGLGHDPAAGAATDETTIREADFKRMAQYRSIVSLGKIDQQQRWGMS